MASVNEQVRLFPIPSIPPGAAVQTDLGWFVSANQPIEEARDLVTYLQRAADKARDKK